VVTPAARREAVRVAGDEFELSERRACRLIGLARATMRYRATVEEVPPARVRMRELAATRPSAGYRTLYRWVRREGFRVNHKRVHRWYRADCVRVRGSTRKQTAIVRVPLTVPTRPNERWSMDFMRDMLADRPRAFRTFNVNDDATRESLVIEVDHSLPGGRVVRVLDALIARRGRPEVIVCDNGPEFISQAVDTWAYQRGIRLHFIAPGKPNQNAFIESFNGRFRAECLDLHWFATLDEARVVIEAWRIEYNTQRPHSSLEDRTPEEYRQWLDAGSPPEPAHPQDQEPGLTTAGVAG
jgi:putative transposase